MVEEEQNKVADRGTSQDLKILKITTLSQERSAEAHVVWPLCPCERPSDGFSGQAAEIIWLTERAELHYSCQGSRQ